MKKKTVSNAEKKILSITEKELQSAAEAFRYRLLKSMADISITASELSEKTGISEANISNYINGKYVAKQDKCFLLAKALNVDPGWLMTGEEPAYKMDLQWFNEKDKPMTPEARILAKGIDSMPQAQREAIVNMMMGLYPNVFKKGTEDDDT